MDKPFWQSCKSSGREFMVFKKKIIKMIINALSRKLQKEKCNPSSSTF